jgi:hypothetical protein
LCDEVVFYTIKTEHIFKLAEEAFIINVKHKTMAKCNEGLAYKTKMQVKTAKTSKEIDPEHRKKSKLSCNEQKVVLN